MTTDPVPMSIWGDDHWSTLAYIETRVVDHKGVLDKARMRCNPRIQGRYIAHHREVVGISPFTSMFHSTGDEYPTRVKNEEIHNHDDWSCLEDMIDADLAEITQYRRNPHTGSEYFGGWEVTVKLTSLGQSLAAFLRQHIAATCKAGTFDPTAVAR